MGNIVHIGQRGSNQTSFHILIILKRGKLN
jgi:hypothetical protein